MRECVCVTVCNSSALEIKARVVRVEQEIKWWNILHYRHAQAHPEHYLYSEEECAHRQGANGK